TRPGSASWTSPSAATATDARSTASRRISSWPVASGRSRACSSGRRSSRTPARTRSSPGTRATRSESGRARSWRSPSTRSCEVIGFIRAANRPAGVGLAGATTLQVLNLCVDPRFATEEVGLALIEHLSNQALQRGVHSLFVRLPLEDRLTRVFRMQAFRQYAIEYVLYNESATATKA